MSANPPVLNDDRYLKVNGKAVDADKLDGFDSSKVSAPNRVPVMKDNALLGTDTLGTGGADATKFLRGDQLWAVPTGGGGGGDAVFTNGARATDANFNDTTPAAPGGGQNVLWQMTGAGPSSISAYLDTSGLVPTSRNINTTAPLTGGGNLSADRTLAVSNATGAAVGVIQLAGDLTTPATAPAIAPNAVTDAKLRTGAATSVIGRSPNSIGNVADIAAGADGQYLRRSAALLGFGAIAQGDLPGAIGTATLNFGAFPGASDASVAVTGQGAIVAGSIVEAWLRPVATADHTADEHMVETLKVFAANIVAGTGFTIYGFNTTQLNEPLQKPRAEAGDAANKGKDPGGSEPGGIAPSIGGRGTRIYGAWTCAWRWS